ncbi:GumC domain-containing protein [Pseudidiomarina salilacus]|uniref:hypothetical protein n=1 Tax=Pseudidiomarina salilacus TaxID=3384452 RepID=UPI00398529FA
MTATNQSSFVIFSSKAFFAGMRALRIYWVALPIVLALLFSGLKVWQGELYQATTVLAPSEERSGGLAEMTAGLAGLAGLAGIDLGGGKINDTQMAVEVMKSRQFLYAFIEQHGLLPYLLPDADAAEQQQIWRGYNELREVLEIEYDRAKGIVTLRLTHANAELAATWLQQMVADINVFMRERERDRVQQQIAYLTETAENVKQADVQESLYRLLQEQYNRAMLVEVNDDYVFETIDPALAPHEPAGLKASIWAVVGVLLGLFLMTLITLFRSYVRA